MKRYHDRVAGESREYAVGEKVFLEGRNIKTARPTKKMEDKWFGPYEVLEKVGASAYRLNLPKTWGRIHSVFNEAILKPAVEPEFPSQKRPPPPPPVIVDEEEEYEVEAILDSKRHRGRLQYLVKWVGYQEPTWEPKTHVIRNAQESVDEFHNKHPNAPK